MLSQALASISDCGHVKSDIQVLIGLCILYQMVKMSWTIYKLILSPSLSEITINYYDIVKKFK